MGSGEEEGQDMNVVACLVNESAGDSKRRLLLSDLPEECLGAIISTLPLPADIVEAFSGNNTPLVISAYELDLVKVGGTGEEERVPLYDLYNHHYKLALGIDDNHTDDFQVRPRLHPHP